MKKIIVLFYCRICVDILGFPVYLLHTKTTFTTKKQNIIDDYFFNKNNTVLYENSLIKQH